MAAYQKVTFFIISHLLESGWLGTFKINSEESACSLFFCKCCPNSDIVIRIDKNTATRKENSFIIRGQSSGLFCGSPLINTFELPESGSKVGHAVLFDKNYKLALQGKRISFECEDSQKCSFVADRITDDFAQYDAIINIDSILSLGTTGWEVWYKNKEDFDRKSKKDTIVIGVAGLYNKGKTWFVNKVAHKNFTAGFHVHTAGLSMKYSEFENKAASYLDTAGFETPITFFGNKDEQIGNSTEDITALHQIKIKDRHLTEHFIQNFIFEKANIIVIVVGHLSFSDQKLINRILSSFGKTNKEIFILHNYFEIQDIKHVVDLIDRDVHGSFDVKIAPLEISKELSDTGYYHQEIYLNRHYPNVRHLVTACEGTAAGDYFNPPVFDFFRALVQSKSPTEPFDLLGLLSTYVKGNLEKYVDIDGKGHKFILDQSHDTPRMRVSINNGSLKIKPISFDVNGALVRTGAFDYHADYDFVLSGQILSFTVELPNLKKDANGKRKLSYKWERGEKLCFIFDAELEDIKPPSTKDLVITQNRKKGKVRVTPPCLDSYFDISEKHENVTYEDGTLIMTFRVERKSDRQVDVEL